MAVNGHKITGIIPTDRMMMGRTGKKRPNGTVRVPVRTAVNPYLFGYGAQP
jgi:hypothetical protein